jgi:hypothetical protein
MPLANDEVTVCFSVAQATGFFTLRASLRAAFLLLKEHGSYSALAVKINDGSFSAYRSILKHACTDLEAFKHLERLVSEGDLYAALVGNNSQLLRFVQMLAGVDPDNDKPETTGKPMTFDEYHTRLFQLGTGWLSWSPEVTWNATASEILTAREGRLDMLKAIFGKTDETTEVDLESPNERAALNALGDLATTRMSEVPNAA